MGSTPRRRRAEAASESAHAAVGLYGDPTVSWSIVLHARLHAPIRADDVAARLAETTVAHPHLGSPPAVREVSAAELPALRDRFASESYERGDPLVRAAVCAEEPGLVIAAHHGVVDGLGLLSLLGTALDTRVTSQAAGLGDREPEGSFLMSAVRRGTEAVLAPPSRITPLPAGTRSDGGDVFVRRDHDRMRAGTAVLAVAATRATERWNRGSGRAASRIVAAVGASRRSGATTRPVQESAFFRLRLQPDARVEDVARMLRDHTPEPEFPARSSGLFRFGTRLLARRLGSTFLVSNLGVVDTGGEVAALAFYPAASGRSGVAFGAVTVDGTTTLTVRARRRDFDERAAAALADGLVDRLDALVGSVDGQLAHE